MRNMLVSLVLFAACTNEPTTELALRDGAHYHLDLTRTPADQVSFAGADLRLADVLGAEVDGIAALDVTIGQDAAGVRIGITNVEQREASRVIRCWAEPIEWVMKIIWVNGVPTTLWFPLMGIVCGQG